MHDLRQLRYDPAHFDSALARRHLPPVADHLLDLDTQRRAALTLLQEAQGKRKKLAQEIGQLKRKGEESTVLEAEAIRIRAEMESLEATAGELDKKIFNILAELPNQLDASVPDGKDETDNVIVHEKGERKTFSFTPKQHFELGETAKTMDFAAAGKISGARFVVLKSALARLERALGQFMLDLHTGEHGYTEYSVPVLVNEQAMYGTDKLPKFADQSFRTEEGMWLIPTAEVSLTAMAGENIFELSQLPQRMTALSLCFRSEAGAAGKDTRGMLRQHQFNKVEMVSYTTEEESEAEHERMTRCAETVLEKLKIPYRRMLLCAGDTGFGAAKTYDLEAWLPGQQAWREISSCSNTKSFQGRRMNARYRKEDGSLGFIHTLNGSGLAVGRTLIAVMENYQNEDGSITIPEVLLPYMGGKTVLTP